MICGPDRARFLAACRGHDLDLMAHWTPLKSIQMFAERIKQRPACLSYAATDDNYLRIESIYERSNRRRELENGAQPNSGCL